MKKARAALGAVIGLALTATGAFAAASAVSTVAKDPATVGGPNDNHGGAVSTLAKGAHGAPDTTTPATTTDTTDPAGAQGAHGAAVSAVAQDETAVGGPNDNHGGAVSLVARGTHGASAIHGKSADKSQADAHKPVR
ncbi:MAG TPA: hypothetical protein VGQ31_08375 [Candidatus Limnocylindrales bacterium]|jgi:hypothetical protein|nr:hypothetical protein [Candidatus Limnocylindrales bacterium]